MPISPFTYEEVVARYDLGILRSGADLTLDETGDLAVARWRDIRTGSLAFNALLRLVQYCRYNEPTLSALFDVVYSMRKDIIEVRADMDAAATTNWQLLTEKHRENIEHLGALALGQQTYAGCPMIALSSLLERFKDDLEVRDEDWKRCGPIYSGYSFGRVVIAAANGFRHLDEWTKTDKPNSRQLRSMNVLEAILGRPMQSSNFLGDVCHEVLHLLSNGGDRNCLSANLFAFAHGVALMDKARNRNLP